MKNLIVDKKSLSARYWSNKELKRIASVFDGEIVNVSAWDDQDKEGRTYKQYFSRATGYYRTNFRGRRGFAGAPGEISLDLTAPPPQELRGRFDVVFNHTTLEHIFEVRAAFANLCTLTRDAVIVVVPFSQLQHETESYGDFWRFTPSCLRAMFAENNLAVVYEAESPERNAAIYLLFVGSRRPEKYRNLLPKYKEIRTAGDWIGARPLVSLVEFAKTRLSRVLGMGKEQ